MLWLALMVSPTGDLATAPDPQQVTGGTEAVECIWPDTVAVTGGGGLCTGSLVHPRVVVYAAHCGAGDKTIRFSQSSSSGRSVATQMCMTNPEYLGVSNQGQDWAFCVLDEEVTEIPVTPPLYGCAVDMIAADQPVVIAGFGDSSGTGGAGTKRWAETTIVSTFGNTVNIGGGGTSTCQGDSGGSAFVRLEDDSWRAISMVSTGIDCGSAGVHALMHPAVPWIEANSGYDITPCHDQDGTWHPTGACTGFFAGDIEGVGTWSDWCEGTAASGPATECGAAFDAVDDMTPPQVSITGPMHAQVFEPGTAVDIAIDASDPAPEWGVRTVWVSIAGMEQDQRDFSEPYGFDGVPFPEGVFTIVAFAEDWDGKVSESEPITIGVGMDVPPDAPGPSDDGGSDDGAVDETGGSGGNENEDGDAGDGTVGNDAGSDDGVATGSGADGGDGDAQGCACSMRHAAPGGWAWTVLALAAIRRRRR